MNKYLDLVREQKNKQWNMKVSVIATVVNVPGMVPKGLEKRLEELETRGRIETIQTTVLLRPARILKRVPEIS